MYEGLLYTPIVHIGDHPFLSPATFIVQVLRLLLAITLTVIVGALYNRYICQTYHTYCFTTSYMLLVTFDSIILFVSVEVLNQVLFSLASCSFHWVVFLIITALK